MPKKPNYDYAIHHITGAFFKVMPGNGFKLSHNGAIRVGKPSNSKYARHVGKKQNAKAAAALSSDPSVKWKDLIKE